MKLLQRWQKKKRRKKGEKKKNSKIDRWENTRRITRLARPFDLHERYGRALAAPRCDKAA